MKVYVAMVNPEVKYDDNLDYLLGLYANIDKAKQDVLEFYKRCPGDMEAIEELYEEYCEENPDGIISLDNFIINDFCDIAQWTVQE